MKSYSNFILLKHEHAKYYKRYYTWNYSEIPKMYKCNDNCLFR